jgi:hypothetical protein
MTRSMHGKRAACKSAFVYALRQEFQHAHKITTRRRKGWRCAFERSWRGMRYLHMAAPEGCMKDV